MDTNSHKHAYCIIAHNEPELLKTLIHLIDDKRNDIFLLIDKKSDVSIFEYINPIHSNLYFSDSVNIRWGGVSQIEAELTVFECALKHGPYKIYHLISGVDLPIKSQDYIHDFIDKHPNTEFMSLDDHNFKGMEMKTRYYHFKTHYIRHPNIKVRYIFNHIRTYSLKLQKLLGIRRQYPMVLHKGANWVSITNELCEYLVSRKKEILTMFKHTFCCDEIFLQSLVWNSEFKNRVFSFQGKYSSLRAIDWQRGNPYVWGTQDDEETDIEILRESPCLFARKFSSKQGRIIKGVIALSTKR